MLKAIPDKFRFYLFFCIHRKIRQMLALSIAPQDCSSANCCNSDTNAKCSNLRPSCKSYGFPLSQQILSYKNRFHKKEIAFALGVLLVFLPSVAAHAPKAEIREYATPRLVVQGEHLVPPEYRERIVELYRSYRIPLDILCNLISYESGWDPARVGPINSNGSRDFGLMQLNSRYLAHFVRLYYDEPHSFNVFIPDHNLSVGMAHLAWLYRETGNWEAAVAAYNCGIGRLLSGSIPEATRRYVRIVFHQAHTAAVPPGYPNSTGERR